MSATPIFTNHISVEQMEEQKRKATAEGMRELAAAMAARSSRVMNPEDESDVSDDMDYSSDEEERRANKRSRTGPKVIHVSNSGTVEKLESRIRFLQLDLTNAHVDVETSKEEVEKLTAVISPYKRVNDELAFLKSSLVRALQNTDNLTKIQLDLRFKLFHEEANEHASLCNASINKIGLDEVKAALLRVLTAERKRIIQTERNFKMVIFKAHAKEVTIKIATSTSIVVGILAILYQLCLWFFF
jgi:hypothetical protein